MLADGFTNHHHFPTRWCVTGGGKTVIPILTAKRHPDKLVVLIAPLNILKQDVKVRAAAAGVDCWVWGEEQMNRQRVFHLLDRPARGLCLVTADKATQQVFTQFLLRQFAQHRSVARVFFDEIHLVLAEFRDVMWDVYGIRPQHCTWSFLTATLPPNLEHIVWDIMATRPCILRPDVSGFGLGTTRLNLEYAVSHNDVFTGIVCVSVCFWVCAFVCLFVGYDSPQYRVRGG